MILRHSPLLLISWPSTFGGVSNDVNAGKVLKRNMRRALGGRGQGDGRFNRQGRGCTPSETSWPDRVA